MTNRNSARRAFAVFQNGCKRWWRACSIRTPIDYAYAGLLLLSILLIAGMGPSIQGYVSNLLTSQEANVYDSAYKNAIQRFPDFQGWLASALDPMVIAATIAIWAATLSVSRARTVLIRGFVAGFASLALLDTVWLALQDLFTFSNAATCFASDLIGAFLIAAIVVAMRSAGSFVARYESQSSATKFVGLVMPIVVGSAVSGSVFVAAKTLYDPAPVEFEATISPKSWGYYRPDMRNDEGETKSFDLFHGQSTDKLVNWVGMSTPLTVDWKSYDVPRNLNVYAFDGCSREYEMLPRLVSPVLRLRGVTTLGVKADEGMSELSLLPGETIALSSKEKDVAQFSIGTKKDGELEYTLFLGDKEGFTYSQEGSKRIFLSAFLLDDTKKPATSKGRSISFLVNGKRYEVDFAPMLPRRPGSSRVTCAPIRALFSSKQRLEVAAGDPMASMVFELEPPSPASPAVVGDRRSNDVRVNGANGWLQFSARKSSNGEQRFAEGTTDFIVISGKFDEFQVAKAAMPTSNANSLQAFGGETNIRVSDEGVFHIDGTANAIYWNNARANQTRWEKMGAAWSTLLLTWVGGLLYFGCKGVLAALRVNLQLGTPL